jgi:hypothetical protein
MLAESDFESVTARSTRCGDPPIVAVCRSVREVVPGPL